MGTLRRILHSEVVTIIVFLGPALLLFGWYMVAPIPMSTFYSLFRWNGISSREYIGLANWIELFYDGLFWHSLINNLKLVVLSIVSQLPVALLLAVFLTSKSFRFLKFFKTIYFIPLLTSSVAVGVLWRYIYDPTFGLLNTFFINMGLQRFALDWLGDASVVLYAVIAAINWRFIPFYMILFMAAIVAIPEEMYEAALIDGATPVQTFFHVTLPMLRNTIINAIILALVGSLKFFDIVFAMTGGGPAHASELMATYMYKRGFVDFRMGYASAIAMAIFLIAFALSIVVLKLTKSREN